MSPTDIDLKRLEAVKIALLSTWLARQPEALAVGLAAIEAHRQRLLSASTPAFELCPRPVFFRCDGQPLEAPLKGLMLGWLAVVNHRYKLDPVALEHVYPTARRPDANAQQALERSAARVELQHPDLAWTLRAVKTRGGVLKLEQPPRVRATSPWLASLFQRDKRVTNAPD